MKTCLALSAIFFLFLSSDINTVNAFLNSVAVSAIKHDDSLVKFNPSTPIEVVIIGKLNAAPSNIFILIPLPDKIGTIKIPPYAASESSGTNPMIVRLFLGILENIFSCQPPPIIITDTFLNGPFQSILLNTFLQSQSIPSLFGPCPAPPINTIFPFHPLYCLIGVLTAAGDDTIVVFTPSLFNMALSISVSVTTASYLFNSFISFSFI